MISILNYFTKYLKIKSHLEPRRKPGTYTCYLGMPDTEANHRWVSTEISKEIAENKWKKIFGNYWYLRNRQRMGSTSAWLKSKSRLKKIVSTTTSPTKWSCLVLQEAGTVIGKVASSPP